MIKTPVIALTAGDPGGIGPEIIVKTLKSAKRSRRAAYVVVGTSTAFKLLKDKTGLSLPWQLITRAQVPRLTAGSLSFLDVTPQALARMPSKKPLTVQPRPGRIDSLNAAMALAALECAASMACAREIQAIVTAPLNKTAIRRILPGFHGHTEYLAEAAGVKKFAMMFVSPRLKVTLATIHVALKNVSEKITKEGLVEKMVLTNEFLKKRMKIRRPKLGIAALNPHGRETGTEEDRVIVPAVKAAQKLGILAEGPVSADRLFFDAYHGVYDGLISMYHDQALAPFKMIAFYDGVNTTLGLPFVRTSPDHGTAFDIAYQGKADASSMRASLVLAESLI
ncbi:MAG: 4-hydroxythreonine-4-phosphate dehydrogenase PdxA [Candidatus Omnitrophica bacterium]|nr:4-hydroxythreonine-4-phosphate dehydrogenase PdxA [Candidatus Omnitrophota bacterium]